MIDAARQSGARLHIQHVSCAETIALLRSARGEGLPVTAEATPHHLALTSDLVLRGSAPDPLAKVNPPLRGEADRRALVAAVMDGTIDAIATDHAPHEMESKRVPFADASFGFSGLETALGLCLRLVAAGELTLERVLECLTSGARKCMLPVLEGFRPGLRPGEPADLVLFDPNAEWTVEPERFRSRGRNTPLAGERLPGRVLLTIAGGCIAHAAEEVPVG
jgi:dihydroorotase